MAAFSNRTSSRAFSVAGGAFPNSDSSSVRSRSSTRLACNLSSSKLSVGSDLLVAARKELVCKGGRNLRSQAVDASEKDSSASTSLSSSISALGLLKTPAADRYTNERSSIIVIGLNDHTAPVEMREKLAVQESQWPEAIGELCALNHIEEAAILSTCNRMEIYVVAMSQRRGVKEVTEWMSNISGVPVSDLCQHRFMMYDEDAVEHLFEVSSGLDSIVLDEGQILAQVRHVVKAGRGVAGFGKKMGGLFEHAITVGKRVRTETNISSGAVSVSSAAVEFGLMKLLEGSYDNMRVLVVGAGKMGKLVIKHLAAKGCKSIVVINGREESVSALSEEFKHIDIIYKPLPQLIACTGEADVVFTCTGAKDQLLLKEYVESLPAARPACGDVRLFIDISVPRNIDARVSDIGSANLYNVDDLKQVVEANKGDRLQKARDAQKIIAEELKQFVSWMDSLETVPTIKKFRANVERIRAAQLEKCLSRLGDNISEKQKKAIYDLSMGISNKLLQGPMKHLKCDQSEGSTLNEAVANMHALNRIFDLQTENSILEEKIRAKVGRTRK